MIAALVATAALHQPANTPPAETCRAWMATHDAWKAGETRTATDGVCFDGPIDTQSANGFIDAIRHLKNIKRLTIVVRSPGGEVEAGMMMGDAIIRMRANVQVEDFCVSSCADYLLAAGKRRTVSSGAILGFHGGVRQMRPEEIRQEALEDQHRNITKIDAEVMSSELRHEYRKQQAFSKAAHIKRGFFLWMDRFSRLDLNQQKVQCEGITNNTNFFVFSPALLSKIGYTINSYAGPQTRLELEVSLKRNGWASDFACYMRS